jgi:hypothetical protein
MSVNAKVQSPDKVKQTKYPGPGWDRLQALNVADLNTWVHSRLEFITVHTEISK